MPGGRARGERSHTKGSAVRSSPGTRGWVLLELLIGLCLFGLAVAPLWTMLASQHEVAVQIARTASDEAAAGDQGPEGLVWTWGAPQVRAGGWKSDGTLTVRTDGPRGSERILLGVWLDGSFTGETETHSGNWAALETGLPSPLLSRAQVVVRARIPAGPWGVPWRTEVPGSPSTPSSGEFAADDPGGWVTVHLPAAGESDTQVRDPFRTTTVPVSLGGQSDVVPVPSGPVSVLTAAHSQDFKVEMGQHVDLYF